MGILYGSLYIKIIIYELSAIGVNIRNVMVAIRSDSEILYNFIAASNSVDGNFNVDSTNIVLSRVTAEFFDSVNFDSTSFNRGWITIQHI